LGSVTVFYVCGRTSSISIKAEKLLTRQLTVTIL